MLFDWVWLNNVIVVKVTYLWNATIALAFKIDSFLFNGSYDGNDHKNRPKRSILPDCCNTSQTHATCSCVKPNVGNNNVGDNELGIVAVAAVTAFVRVDELWCCS